MSTVEKLFNARQVLEATGRKGEATLARWTKEGILAQPLLIGGRRTWTAPQVEALLRALRRRDEHAQRVDGLDLAQQGQIFRRLQRAVVRALDVVGADKVGAVLKAHGSSDGTLRAIPPHQRESATRALQLVSP